MLKSSIALLFSFCISTAISADVITVRGDIWCPYNCQPKSDKPGYMIEILQETLGKSGHTIDYQELNWARAIEETRIGKYNAIVGASHTDAPDFIFPATAMGKGNTCFFVLPTSKWRYEGIKSLENITLGVIRGYSWEEKFDQYVKENENNSKRIDTVSGNNPLVRNLQKLKTGRIQVVIEDTYVFAYEASLLKEKFETKNAGCVKDVPNYVAFSPKNKNSKKYAEIVSNGLLELRKAGKLQTILDKYKLVDDFK